MSRIRIGVTDCSKYPNYANWIEGIDIEVVRLSYHEKTDIGQCDGYLLTGGEDVHPRFYGKPELLPYCHAHDLDEKRDEFELELLALSQKKKIPVLGICRGLQIANVFFGGTLIPDILSWNLPDHSKIKGNDRYHGIDIVPGSLLSKITSCHSGQVNSAHHQAADTVGDGLTINAHSTDGVVEGLEKKMNSSSSFVLLVQWHPERMSDSSSPLTKSVRASFLEAVTNNRNAYANH